MSFLLGELVVRGVAMMVNTEGWGYDDDWSVRILSKNLVQAYFSPSCRSLVNL